MAARIVSGWPPRDAWPGYLAGWLVCSWRGHRWQAKMSGRVCRRCRVFDHD